MTELENLVGKTITSFIGEVGAYEVHIITPEGTLLMYHRQDCCEHVYLEDVVGDPLDLIGHKVIVAEERDSLPTDPQDEENDLFETLWTFYEIRTTGGDLSLRWMGSSNGYYGMSVDLSWSPNEQASN